MPDCMAAKLTFGGTMPAAAFEAILSALDADGIAIGDVESARAAAAVHDLIEIQDAERAWGSFPATEAALLEHGVPL